MRRVVAQFKRKMSVGDFGKVLLRFASTQMLYNILKMVAGLLVVRLVVPEIYGAFTGVGVYLGYVMLGQIGVFNGLKRELPYELGRKHHRYANLLAGAGWSVTLVVSSLVALVFLYFFFKAVMHGDTRYMIINGSYVIIGALHLASKNYLPSLYRTNSEFNTLSRINVYLAIFNIASVSLLLWHSLYGLCTRGILLIVVEFSALFYFRPFKVRPIFSFNLIKRLIHTGFPIYMLGQVRQQWYTVINTMIVTLGGATAFGYYALANIVNGALGVVPTAFSQVIAPKMYSMHGQKRPVKEVLKITVKPIIFQLVLISSVATVTAFLLPPLVEWFVPKYAEGIPAAQWALFIPVVLCLTPALSYFNVVKRQKWYFVSLLTGALLGTAYIYYRYLTDGFELVFFPQGIIIGTILQTALGIFFLMRLRKDIERSAAV